MDVVIETADGTCFTQEISFFSTVLEIKEMLQNCHYYPVPNQILFFNGIPMEDERNTEYYNIFHGSRIFLQLIPNDFEMEPEPEMNLDIKPTEPRIDLPSPPPAQVTVKIPFFKTQFNIPINSTSDSITQLKERIRDRLHQATGSLLQVNRVSLLHSGRELVGNHQLGECGIVSGAEIEMVIKPLPVGSNVGKRVKVTVVLPGSVMKVQVEMNITDCVSELRNELHRMKERHHFQLPQDGFFFIFKQLVMEENHTLRWHGVRSGDVIDAFHGTVTAGT